jgi:hypothetical protein
MAGLPLFTPEANRMMYVVKNKKQVTVRQIILTPYLHERKILLNKTRSDCEYFSTTFYIEDNRKVLLSINITDSKYYIYSLKGILRERVNFQKLTQKYGKARSVSNNG